MSLFDDFIEQTVVKDVDTALGGATDVFPWAVAYAVNNLGGYPLISQATVREFQHAVDFWPRVQQHGYWWESTYQDESGNQALNRTFIPAGGLPQYDYDDIGQVIGQRGVFDPVMDFLRENPSVSFNDEVDWGFGGDTDTGGGDWGGGDWNIGSVGDWVGMGQQLYQAYNQVNAPAPVPRTIQTGGQMITDGGDIVPTAGVVPAIAGGAVWLGRVLGMAYGRASSVFTGANGVRVRMTQLWPYVRQYGATTVAAALGISLGALGELLARAPTKGRTRRGRGITARDVRTTRRTLRTIKKLYYMMPTRPSSRRSWGRYRSYRRR